MNLSPHQNRPEQKKDFTTGFFAMACGHVLTDAGDEISMCIRENPSHIYIPSGYLNGPFIDGLPIKKGDFPWLC